MSRDKQIEEMAKQLYGNFGLSMPTARNIATYLTNKKGYRKASDVALEVIDEVYELLKELKDDYISNDEISKASAVRHGMIIVAELKNKYSEGGE